MGTKGPPKGFVFPKKTHKCPDCNLVEVESANGRKLCAACKKERQRVRGAARWADPERRARLIASTQRWLDANPEWKREYGRRRQATRHRQGFAREFLDERLAEQGGKCALERAGKCYGDLVVDHCHETGAFRGWLCRHHNIALGKLGDSAESIRLVLGYLDRS